MFSHPFLPLHHDRYNAPRSLVASFAGQQLAPNPSLIMASRARMENLHAPTVPSGPTSSRTTNGTQINGITSFAQLQAKKDNIEAEIRALSSVLDSVYVTHPHKMLILMALAWRRYEYKPHYA
jgi:hypothetical protein